jgi:hypothetical protein
MTSSVTKTIVETQTRLFNEYSDKLQRIPIDNSRPVHPTAEQVPNNRPPPVTPAPPALTVNHLAKLLQENKIEEAFSAVCILNNL